MLKNAIAYILRKRNRTCIVFIIYKADKKDDELFYANREFLHMTGYKNLDEFFSHTKKSFRNLIREDEQKQMESST